MLPLTLTLSKMSSLVLLIQNPRTFASFASRGRDSRSENMQIEEETHHGFSLCTMPRLLMAKTNIFFMSFALHGRIVEKSEKNKQKETCSRGSSRIVPKL